MRSNAANISGVLALLLVMSFAATLVAADPNSAQSLTQVSSTKRDLSTLPPSTVGAQGGNVTELNIQALTITQSWQGYYGNVTGTVSLQDGNNNTFYNWSSASPSGEIYATRNASVSWTSVNCTNSSQRTSEETYLGQSATDADSVSNTFTTGSHPAFSVGSNSILASSCYRTYGYANNQSQSSNFVMVMLNNAHNVIYTTIINDSATGFNGKAYDFELLVGENEKAGNIGATPYYFFVELS
jgi:hypothetical protein